MSASKEYEARVDAKRRITLRGPKSDRFSVVHRPDGSIVLKPLAVVEDTPAARKARFDRAIAEAKARGKKIPAGVKLIDFRDLTPKERAYGKALEGHARRCLSRNRRNVA